MILQGVLHLNYCALPLETLTTRIYNNGPRTQGCPGWTIVQALRKNAVLGRHLPLPGKGQR